MAPKLVPGDIVELSGTCWIPEYKGTLGIILEEIADPSNISGIRFRVATFSCRDPVFSRSDDFTLVDKPTRLERIIYGLE